MLGIVDTLDILDILDMLDILIREEDNYLSFLFFNETISLNTTKLILYLILVEINA